MKIHLLCIVCALVTMRVGAQNFERKIKLNLPDSLKTGAVLWGDMNNDGLLDVVVDATTHTGRAYLLFVQTDTLNGPAVNTMLPVHQHSRIELMDYNRDNMMDLLVFGKAFSDSTFVFLNEEDFTFRKSGVHNNTFPVSRFADLDDDGSIEWIANVITDSGSYVKIMKHEQDQWHYVDGGWKMNASDIEILPGDGDGFTDIFLSGHVGVDSVFTGVLRGDGELNFRVTSSEKSQGDGVVTDLNADGLFDILFTGRDNNSVAVTRKWIGNANETFTISNHDTAYDSVAAFVVDLNSNGIPDVSYLAHTTSGDTINVAGTIV